MYKIDTSLFCTRLYFLDKSVGFGENWNKVMHVPTFEHDIFFHFLLSSPSYALAHKYRNKKILKGIKLPADFKNVQETYKLVGDIFNSTFEDWWQKGGYKLFDYQNDIKRLSLNINLDKPINNSIDDALRAIKDAYKFKSTRKSNQKIKFIINKMHLNSLLNRKNFIVMKALCNRFHKRDFEHWRVAIAAKIFSKWTDGLKINSKVTKDNLQARTALTELSSKLLYEGWLIAENAARLKFPSKDFNPNALPINFVELGEVMFKYCELEEQLLKRYSNQPNKLIRDKYTLNAHRDISKKKFINAKIKDAVDEAVSKALKKERDERAKLAQLHFSSSHR